MLFFNSHKFYFSIFLSLVFFTSYAQEYNPGIDISDKPVYTNLNKALRNPEKVFKLRLNNQQLTEFPLDLFKLTELRILYLDSNLITSIPPRIKELKFLRLFSITSNKLTGIPDEIGSLSYLEIVYFGNNEITTVPPALCLLSQLTFLSFHQNNIKELPNEIRTLKGLEILDVGKNQLLSVPDNIGHLYNLEKLSFSGNNLKKLPPHFFELSKLKALFLSENNFSKIDSNINKLKKLELLSFENNQLTELPAAIGDLYYLEKFYLENNLLEQFPAAMGNLYNLKILNIENNPLKSLPVSFKDLKNLKKMYVQNFKVQPLPAVLFDMQRNGTEIKGLDTKDLYKVKLLMSQGRNKKLTENFAEAIPKFEELLNIDTNNTEALSELAASYLETGEYDKAAQTCKKALQKEPSVKTLSDLQVTLSNSLNKNNKQSSILNVYQEKINAEPANAQPLFDFGKYYYFQAKYEEAKQLFEKAIATDPKHAYSHFYLAVTNLKLEKKDPFIFSALRYIALEPTTNKSTTLFPFILTKMKMTTGVETKRGSKNYYDSYIVKDENYQIIYKGENPNSDLLMAIFSDLSSQLKENKSDDDSTKAIKKIVGEVLNLNKNNVEVFQIELTKICKTNNDSIPSNEKNSWNYYQPYYNAIIQNGHLETYAYIINANRNKEPYIEKWLKANQAKVQAFYDWDKKYKWG